jgi:hypothetical protein
MSAQTLSTRKKRYIIINQNPIKSVSEPLILNEIVNQTGMASKSNTVASLQYFEILFFFIAKTDCLPILTIYYLPSFNRLKSILPFTQIVETFLENRRDDLDKRLVAGGKWFFY